MFENNSSIMKRSRNEVVKATVGSYLKRRHYTDTENFRKSELHLSQTVQQMAVFEAVDKEVARKNTIIFSSINNDISQIDHQFSRLKSWISEMKAENCKSELAALLCPLFCRLYLEMLRGGHRQSVAKFFKRHQGLFVTREHSRELVEELACVYSNQDIDSSPVVKAFRSCKYRVQLSDQSLLALQKYLSVHGHVILIQVLQTWFDLEIEESCKQVEEEEENDSMDSTSEQIPERESEKSVQYSEADMSELEEVIRIVREGPPSPSPMLLYTIGNAEDNVTCAQKWTSMDMMAAGLGSEVRLWSLAQHKSLSSPCPNVSQIRLACDGNFSHKPHTAESDTVALRGHSGAVQDIALVQDGLILSVSYDTTMRAWRTDDYSNAAIYRGHNYPIWCVDISALGVYVATGSRDHSARLWSLEYTFPLRIFSCHNQDVEAVKFHPNGSYLATGSTDKTVRLWAVSDAKLVRVFPGHKGAIQALAFSPDGKLIASAGEDKRIRVWDLGAGTVLQELKGHSQPVLGLTWSQDGECLASCGLDGTVRVWNVKPRPANSSVHLPPDLITTYTTDCSSLLSVRYSHTNTLEAVGVM